MSKLPDAWTQASPNKVVAQAASKVEAKTELSARVDMSDDVAGRGLCPECRKPMEASMANGHHGLVCHADRIFIPAADTSEYMEHIGKSHEPAPYKKAEAIKPVKPVKEDKAIKPIKPIKQDHNHRPIAPKV